MRNLANQSGPYSSWTSNNSKLGPDFWYQVHVDVYECIRESLFLMWTGNLCLIETLTND